MDNIRQFSEQDAELFRTRLQNEPETAFSLSDDGNIIWTVPGENGTEPQVHAIAKAVKSDNFYLPGVETFLADTLPADEEKSLRARLETWLHETVKKKLAFLFILENAPIKGTGKGIAFQLFEEQGIIFRPRIQNLVKPLELADRQALSRLGVRIGSHYVYAKDSLKPAAVRLAGILWRTFHPDAKNAVTPHDGNVSFAVPENAPKRFYLTLGYPIFGDLAVRVDMIERLNSAIFEKAVEGEYTFDPAISSTIGASVEQTHKVLADLGFPVATVTRPKVKPATPETAAVAAETPEAVIPDEPAAVTDAETVSEPAETETVTVYSLKRVKPQREEKKQHREPRSSAPKNDKHDNKSGKSEKTEKSFRPRPDKKGKDRKQAPRDNATAKAGPSSHGHNAFAGLDMLLKLQENK